MRKVEYPKDRESLKSKYKDVFSDILPTLETNWSDFKKKYPELRQFNVTIEQLLTMEYDGLVIWYLKFVKSIDEDKRKSLCKKKDENSLYCKCFNYDLYYDRIKNFFLNKANEFNFHVCHYCEMSYINTYTVSEDEQLFHCFNEIGLLELFKGLKKKHKLESINIWRHLPFRNIEEMNRVIKKDFFLSDFLGKCKEKAVATFDIDHVLDKGSCPLVALSLFNFVPSCHVCNSRIKNSGVLGMGGQPIQKLSPTSKLYDFDRSVKIKLISKNGLVINSPLEHLDEYELVFDTKDAEYNHAIGFFNLNERYNYHIAEAVRILDIKQKYNDTAMDLITNSFAQGTGFSYDEVREDLLGIKFHKKHNRCFEKLYRDVDACT